MQKATKELLRSFDEKALRRRREILAAPDGIKVTGTSYYVSSDGDDGNDGRTPGTAWKTIRKVSQAGLCPGDGVFFRRGDIFRGKIMACAGVTYAAYGSGEKPKIYGWDKSLADPLLWELYDREHMIWRLKEPILDCGTLVFDGGKVHCRKLIPSYINARFVCRDDEARDFDMTRDMTCNLDMVCLCTSKMTERESHGQTFPVPLMDDENTGELYLRCDGGNPAEVFCEIEALPRRAGIRIDGVHGVTIDNLCIKYVGAHAISAGHGPISGLHISNCEIGWIGGTVQNYLGLDPNYPQGGRGTVTRFGNAIETYGGCSDYVVSNCYIYQVYDAGITHQFTTAGKNVKMTGIRYENNLIENCVYSIEYFLNKTGGDTESCIDGCEICGNILRLSGYGWGQQRHNTDTPAHIKGWGFENTARNFFIHDNIFDRAAYRMVHLVAKKAESCPRMYKNTYIQKLDLPLGQYGANEVKEPELMLFDLDAEEKISNVLGDAEAEVYYID